MNEFAIERRFILIEGSWLINNCLIERTRSLTKRIPAVSFGVTSIVVNLHENQPKITI